MMPRCPRTLAVFALYAGFLCSPVADVFAQQAFVQSREQGQAWLFTRPDGCYAVTPNHVVKDAAAADLLFTTQAVRQFVRGAVVKRWPEEDVDLALLKVDSGDLDRCGAFLVLPEDISATIAGAATGELRYVDDHGGMSVYRADVTQIEPSAILLQAAVVMPTYSGSVFFVRETPVGMVLKIRTHESKPHEVIVLRMDEITRRVVSYLTAERGPSSSTEVTPGCRGSQGVAGNEVSAQENGARVVSWSALPERLETGAENLIAAGGCGGVWRAAKPSFPVSIIIDLAGAEPVRIAEVTLDGSRVNRRDLPNEYEILVRTRGRGGWRTIGSGTFAGRDRVSQSVPNVLASELMLKIYGGQSADAVALRRVIVSSADTH